jgi:hypothetical protein
MIRVVFSHREQVPDNDDQLRHNLP